MIRIPWGQPGSANSPVSFATNAPSRTSPSGVQGRSPRRGWQRGDRGAFVIVEACARADVPGGYGDASTHLAVQIDVVVRLGAVAELA
jgi:hypothetical protein